jgi:hypothetical protein
MPGHDLLSPAHLSGLYAHQIRQTINAYDPPHVVLGEGLQNALDAVEEAGGGGHTIGLTLDFRERRVTITDDGVGFPNDPTLLFLGGTQKAGKDLYGMIGAGLKVVLFCSNGFALRARAGAGHFRVDLQDAHRFTEDPPPALIVPEAFDPDPNPLGGTGTELSYVFPAGGENGGVFASCFDRIIDACLPGGATDPLAPLLERAVSRSNYPARFAVLLSLFLRRFTYVGDVRGALGTRPADRVKLAVKVIRDGTTGLANPLVDEFFDGEDEFEFEVAPRYVTVEDTYDWSPADRRLSVFHDQLGRGGENMTRTNQAFNHIALTDPDAYKRLLENRRGTYSTEVRGWMDEFERLLFPRINGITLTIGHIPDFYRCLPGGSRRVVSANGVVTTHELAFHRGQNQQYVRCFDICIDVDAQLNWGKSQITDLHLINRVRRYADAAYAAVIQNAAKVFVGQITDEDEDEEGDIFLGRDDLGLPNYVLQKVPTSEQDVIALLFELAGHGVFGDYRFFGLSSKDRYDSRAAIVTEGEDPTEVFSPTNENRLRVVEFKHTAAHLVTDLDRNQKDAADIHLLVAWREGTSPSQQYVFEDIAHSRAAQQTPSRVFPHVERFMQDTRSGRQIQVLLLDRVVARLKAELTAPAEASDG